MKNYSVIIVSKNRYEKLKRAIASLNHLAQIKEIIVIDNNSTDTRYKAFQNLSNNKIIYIKNSINKGVAENRNIGINRASSDGLIFLDDDAYVQRLNLLEISEYFTSNVNVGVVAPKLTYPDGRLQESVRSFPTLPALIWRGLKIYKITEPSWYKKYVFPVSDKTHIPTEVPWAIGACLIMRKAIFTTIGIFDEKFFFGYEDADFCLRSKKLATLLYTGPNQKLFMSTQEQVPRFLPTQHFTI